MADIDKELRDIKNAVYGREVRGSIHDGIKKINEEVEDSTETSEQAKHQVENIQEQVDNLVVSGDSSVEAAQARVDKDNHNYSTLKERLDTEQQQFETQLADEVQQRKKLTKRHDLLEKKAGLVESLDFEYEFSIDPRGWDIDYDSHGVVPRDFQSMVMTETHIYLTGSQKPSTEPLGIIFEINKQTLQLERYLVAEIYHSNGMTYCDDYNGNEVLVISNLWNDINNESNILTIVSIDELEVIETIELNENSRSISYDKESEFFISVTHTSRIFYNKQFKEIKRVSVPKRGVSQANTAIFGFNIVPYTYEHILAVEDYNGNLLKKYYIGDKVPEVEAFSFIDNEEQDSFLVLTNTGFSRPIDFYRVKLFANDKGYYDYSPYSERKTLSDKLTRREIYIDSNFIGYPDGSEERPFATIGEGLKSLPYEGHYLIFIEDGTYDEDVVIDGFYGALEIIPKGDDVRIKTLMASKISGSFKIHDGITFFGVEKLDGNTTTSLVLRDVRNFQHGHLKFDNVIKSDYCIKIFHSEGIMMRGLTSNNSSYDILLSHVSTIYLGGNVNTASVSTVYSDYGSTAYVDEGISSVESKGSVITV